MKIIDKLIMAIGLLIAILLIIYVFNATQKNRIKVEGANEAISVIKEKSNHLEEEINKDNENIKDYMGNNPIDTTFNSVFRTVTVTENTESSDSEREVFEYPPYPDDKEGQNDNQELYGEDVQIIPDKSSVTDTGTSEEGLCEVKKYIPDLDIWVDHIEVDVVCERPYE